MHIGDLMQNGGPFILYWNQNHFVVLYKISCNGTRFHVADPGKGLIVYDNHDFIKHWIGPSIDNNEKGIAMYLEPTD